jgi:hypothetical protein
MKAPTMKAPTMKWFAVIFLLAWRATISPGRLDAYELNLATNLPPFDFHGFASQGFLYSGGYNYLGDTTHGSFKFSEAGLNTSFNPLPRTRIAAQAFTYDMGEAGKYDVVLDYALAEYTFNDSFGIRAGRIRRPQGIYNDNQDVDVARIFVLLPQGMYDARWRDFTVSLDGGEFFGTLPLPHAGSLSYEIYAGLIRPSQDGGLALQIRNNLPAFVNLDAISSATLFGGQLWWNTPVEGLRIGAAASFLPEVNFISSIQTPGGPVYPDNRTSALIQQYSAEYLWKAWTFQSEINFYDVHPAAAGVSDTHSFRWYASAAYRFSKWFEAGGYYTQDYEDLDHTSSSRLDQNDAALTLRFDPKEWWTFKIEGHYLQGTGLLQDNASNPVQSDNGWWLLAVKTTFSF